MFLFTLMATLALAGEHVLAVVPFHANTADTELAPIGDGLANMMVTDLGEAASVTVVERTRIDALLQELKFQQTEFIDPSTAQTIGRILGASALVTGSLSETSGTVRIDARVIDVASGKVLVSAEQQGAIERVFELERRVALGVLEGLEVSITDDHRKRLGGSGPDKTKMKPGQGFDDHGPRFEVWRKGLMAGGWLWVDGVKINKVRASAPVAVGLIPGRHEIIITDDEAIDLSCAGVVKISKDSSWSTRELCQGLNFGNYGDFGTARRGGLLDIKLDNNIEASINGPTRVSGSGLKNVEPGLYTVSAKLVTKIPEDERSDDLGAPRETETPVCNTVVEVGRDVVTRLVIGGAGCGSASAP